MNSEQIAELFGSVPYFADDVIQPLHQEEGKRQFVRVCSWCHEGSINIQRVCGTMHPDYIGLTWRELLAKGRRMENNLKLFRTNPEYYTVLQYKRMPSMHYSIVDGKGYVTEDGNHRTCIARFFLYGQESPFLHGVYVSEQQTNLHMLALYNRLLTKLPGFCKATPQTQESHRDDGNGWATHWYTQTILIENMRRRGFSAVLTEKELEEELLPALDSPFRRFGSYRNLLG